MPKRQPKQVDGREVVLSNLEKVYFPASGFTKGAVIEFYDTIAEFIVPHLHGRPLTLKRFPEGVPGEHFYEKNAPKHTPAWVQTFPVPRSEGGADIRYILCNDRATLLWATNLGDIEMHVLLSQVPRINYPTAAVFDLDPGEPAGLLECCRVALQLREMLAAWKLEAFVKVSGSKGLHLSVPLDGETPYELAQPFAKAVAELAAHQHPQEVVSEMAKSVRRGKVLIDWSQNSDFKTTVGVYALRAKGAEPFVSMPITWAEVERAVKRRDVSPLAFTPAAAVRRLHRQGDLFAPVLTQRQALPAVFTEALAAGPPPKLSTWPRNRGRTGDKTLREYAEKRDHTRTPEPAAQAGPVAGAGAGRLRFVIQKHAASHLHYDWRLEMQGVLRSWAVPKGPPLQLRETHLAMHVEDHPLAYAAFEGTIPPGNYGAGTVMVWDHGEYEDLTGNPAAAFWAGKMHVTLYGQKLRGEWILVKDRRDDEGQRWLLIKAGATLELPAKADDTSAVSGRSLERIAQDNDAQWQSHRPAASPAPAPKSTPVVRRGEVPRFYEPMQSQPVTALPVGAEWRYEIKFDGYRGLAVKKGRQVTLYSRNENVLNERFPGVVAALEGLPGEFVLDGELVALDAAGRPSFQEIQDSHARQIDVLFYAFDLLQRDGENLRNSSLERRREALEGLLAAPVDPLRLSPLLQAPAGEILDAVGQLGLEGVVAKRLGSPYEPGERSGAWLKYRTNREQEFVVGGFVPGGGGFDSLLIGVYEAKRFLYVGKVKNGFVPRTRAALLSALDPLRQSRCPFANLPESKSSRWGQPLTAEKMQECRWVKPKLVVQVAFVQWTDAGHLRHCTFRGLRDDKRAAEVVRET